MGLRTPAILLGLLLAAAAGAGQADLQQRIDEIARLNVTAPWQESQVLIDRLRPELAQATRDQRIQLELIEIRNLALAGESHQALGRIQSLVDSGVEGLNLSNRVRTFELGINLAANAAEFGLAFLWMNQALAILDEESAEGGIAPILGMAAYLTGRAGEYQLATEYGQRAVLAAQRASNGRILCVALGDYALALTYAKQYREAEAIYRQELEQCRNVGDPVFEFHALDGVAQTLAERGSHQEAVQWLQQAITAGERSGYVDGLRESRRKLAESLLALDQIARADQLLAQTCPQFEQLELWESARYCGEAQSQSASAKGDFAAALDHLRRANIAAERFQDEDKAIRLAYLQVQFDTRFKEQQIAALQRDKALARLEQEAARHQQQLQRGGIAVLLLLVTLLILGTHRNLRNNRRYRWLSEHDGLTRLYNHQKTLQLGQQAFVAARQQGQPFTAVIGDIDLFKQINDRHGHAAGDEVLRALGRWLQEVAAGHGIVGRTGGEEFSLMLQLDAEASRALLERLRQRIEPLEIHGQCIRVTMSFGLFQAPPEADSLELVLRKADMALYAAKHSGRDRVVDAAELSPRQQAAIFATD